MEGSKIARVGGGVILFLVVTFFAGVFVVQAAGAYWHNVERKINERDDAISRYTHYCQDSTVVMKTNYGAKCRQYREDTKIVPWWDGLVTTSDSYGFPSSSRWSSAGTYLFLMCFPVTCAGVWFCFHFARNYKTVVEYAAASHDQDFMYNQKSSYNPVAAGELYKSKCA